MSLEQLQQAASELGIKPHLISKAAADIASGTTGRPGPFWGPRTHLYREGVVSHRISEDNWPTFLSNMRRVSGRVGDSGMLGKSFEWTNNSPDSLHVTVSPQGEQSRVTIASRYGEWGIVFYFLPMIFTFLISVTVMASTSFSGPVDAAISLGLLATALGLGHLGFCNLANARRKTAQAIMTVLETPTEQTVTETGTAVTAVSDAQTVAPYQTQIEIEREVQSTQPVMQVVNRK